MSCRRSRRSTALQCSRRTWNLEEIQENNHALLDALEVISGGLQLHLEFLLATLQLRFHSAELRLRSVEVCLDIIKTFGKVERKAMQRLSPNNRTRILGLVVSLRLSAGMTERSVDVLFYKNVRSVLYKQSHCAIPFDVHMLYLSSETTQHYHKCSSA